MNVDALPADLDAYLMPQEPFAVNGAVSREILAFATTSGFSDIKITSGKPVMGKVQGRVRRLTRRALTTNETMEVLADLYGANGPSLIAAQDLDGELEFSPTRDVRYRFRWNAIGGATEGGRGVDITYRTIYGDPPSLAQAGLTEEFAKLATPRDGLVLIAGATGSGKTTAIAALIKYMLEEPNGNRFITTFEDPREFMFDRVHAPTGHIWQSSVGPVGDIATWSLAIRNAMRRAPNMILLGETRDTIIAENAIAASLSGHLVYTTLHANSTLDCFPRIVNWFPAEARQGVMSDLLRSMKMIMWQTLVPLKDGSGRTPIREFLVFDEEVRAILQAQPISDPVSFNATFKETLARYGQTMKSHAVRLHDEGKISEANLRAFTLR